MISNFDGRLRVEISERVAHLTGCLPQDLLLEPALLGVSGCVGLRFAFLQLVNDQEAADPNNGVCQFDLMRGRWMEGCFGICELAEKMRLV